MQPMNPCDRLLTILDIPTCKAADRDPLHLLDVLLSAGARRFWYRNHSAANRDVEAQLRDVLALAVPAGGHVVAGCDPQVAVELGLHGVHLSSAAPRFSSPAGDFTVGRSCHSLADVAAASGEGTDYVTLSPVWPTTSPKTYSRAPLGLAAVEVVTKQCPVQVFALGGVVPERTRDCLGAGATGVAVLGAICLSPSPENVVKRFLDEIARYSEAGRG